MQRATQAEKDEYRGVYRLHGWVNVAGTRCAVEYVGDRANGLMYEIMAPEGHHFGAWGDGLHSILCENAADVHSMAGGSTIEKCDECSEVIG